MVTDETSLPEIIGFLGQRTAALLDNADLPKDLVIETLEAMRDYLIFLEETDPLDPILLQEVLHTFATEYINYYMEGRDYA